MPYYVAVQPVLCQCCFNGLEARDKDAAVTFLTLNYFISYEDQLHFNGVGFFGGLGGCQISYIFSYFFTDSTIVTQRAPSEHFWIWQCSNKNTHAHSTDTSIYCKGFARKLIFMLLCFVEFVPHFLFAYFYGNVFD